MIIHTILDINEVLFYNNEDKLENVNTFKSYKNNIFSTDPNKYLDLIY